VTVEAFESFVALALEAEEMVVSEAVKFPVTRPTAKTAYAETQTHGIEVDLVAARMDRLVLATVKSFLGSRGVDSEHVMGESGDQRANNRYALLNNPTIRAAVVAGACERYGYAEDQVELRLYVGKFAGDAAGKHEQRVREWCGQQTVGGFPIRVFGLNEIATAARRVATSKTYRNSPALVAIKVLDAAGMLLPLRDGPTDT
jgi:hypothetical protein